MIKAMKFLKENLCKVFLLTFLIVAPVLSLAQVTGKPPIDVCKTGTICNPIKAIDLNTFIKTLLEGVLKIGIPIIALAIIYSGFLFVAARGNEEKLTKAKSALLYTLIGAAILLGSWAIAQLISETVLAL